MTKKNEDGFEPGQLLSAADIAHINKKARDREHGMREALVAESKSAKEPAKQAGEQGAAAK